jgi:hypothetical protein
MNGFLVCGIILYHSAISYIKTKNIFMKRFILSAAVLVVAGLATVKANNLNTNIHTVAIVNNKADSVQKTSLKLEALPDPVKTVLSSDVFKTWVPSAAFAVTAGTTQYYEVDVKKGTETKALKFDKDGKIIQ